MRTIDLSKLEKRDPVTFILSADVEMKLMLIRVPKEYDLVCTLQYSILFYLFIKATTEDQRATRYTKTHAIMI